MESEGFCTSNPATGTCPEPDESSPHFKLYVFKIPLIFACASRSSDLSLPLRFSDQVLFTHATCPAHLILLAQDTLHGVWNIISSYKIRLAVSQRVSNHWCLVDTRLTLRCNLRHHVLVPIAQSIRYLFLVSNSAIWMLHILSKSTRWIRRVAQAGKWLRDSDLRILKKETTWEMWITWEYNIKGQRSTRHVLPFHS
jgi:hypothetical protein